MYRPFLIALTIASSGCLILADGPALTDATYGLKELEIQPNFDVKGVNIVATATSDSFKFAESVVLIDDNNEIIADPSEEADGSDVERTFVIRDTSLCALGTSGLIPVVVNGPDGLEAFSGEVPWRLSTEFLIEDEERDTTIFNDGEPEYVGINKGQPYAFCGRLDSTGVQAGRFSGDVDIIPVEFSDEVTLWGTVRTSPDLVGEIHVLRPNGDRITSERTVYGEATFYIGLIPQGTRLQLVFVGRSGPPSSYELRLDVQ